MARRSRVYIDSGLYHVVLKGSGGQIIFEDDEDRCAFISCLDAYRREFEVRILAWCLMSNHVHLVLADDDSRLSKFMHSVATAYACRFNRRHLRTGALFDGRFHSVGIDSDAQLLRAVRYVHDNPIKSGICLPSAYQWSSYREYLSADPAMVDTAPVLDIIGGLEHFEEFGLAEKYAGYVPVMRARLGDVEALQLAAELLGPERLRSLRSEPSVLRAQGIQVLRDAGLTMKQIQRCTGIGRGIISRTTHGPKV